jgi:hypothetical protein
MWCVYLKMFDFYLGVWFSKILSMGKESIWQDLWEGFILWAYVTGLIPCSPGVRLSPDLAPRVRVVALSAWGPLSAWGSCQAPSQFLPLGIASAVTSPMEALKNNFCYLCVSQNFDSLKRTLIAIYITLGYYMDYILYIDRLLTCYIVPQVDPLIDNDPSYWLYLSPYNYSPKIR